MRRVDVKVKVINSIKQTFGDVVVSESKSLKGYNITESKHIELIENLSEEFNIIFNYDEIDELMKIFIIKDIIEYIYTYMKPFDDADDNI